MTKPYLVVRANINPGVMDEFLRWYVDVHLPHVMAIPGIERAYRSNCHRAGINWTALYEIKDDASVNVAITNLSFDCVNAGYQVVVPVDAVAGTQRSYVEQVFEHTLRNVATLVTTDDLLRAWSGAG